MIDTVSLKITIELTGEYEERDLIKRLKKTLSRIKNVDKLKLNEDREDKATILLRFSYPRHYANYNVFLISTNEECIEVHRDFIEQLEREFKYIDRLEWLKERVKISLQRVDVPLTYVSKNIFEQNRNILNILREVGSKSLSGNKTYNGKEIESLILANNKNIHASDLKITIYNQMQKFKDVYRNKLDQIYEELPWRIRIELSKRVKRNPFTLDQFKEFEIFNEYVYKFTRIILDILFNKEKLEKVYLKKEENLKISLEKEQSTSSFTYKAFVYKYKSDIWDYKLLRNALKLISTNTNTVDKAASTIRGVLEELERDEDIKYFGILQEVDDMRMSFEKILKGENKNEIGIKK